MLAVVVALEMMELVLIFVAVVEGSRRTSLKTSHPFMSYLPM
jgi:hypothetical protein